MTPVQLRQVLGAFATGVTVVTALDERGRRIGLTANSFNSVSMDPPLILWSLSNRSPNLASFLAADHFVVNILAEDQTEVSTRFATPIADKFEGVAVRPGHSNAPVLDNCAAFLECRRYSTFPGGDHTVFLGLVEHCGVGDARPLVFERGRYARAEPMLAR